MREQTCLAIPRSESHPRRTSPPSHNKANESSVFWASTFSGPDVDGAAKWQSRANFGQYSGGNPHEHDRNEVRRPVKIFLAAIFQLTNRLLTI